MDRRRRVLLDDSVTREDVEYAAFAFNWHLADQIQARPGFPFKLIYKPADSPEFVYYIEDGVVALCYFEADQNAAGALAVIRQRLATQQPESVLAMLRGARSSDEARLALRQAAIVAPREFDAGWFDAIRRWFDDPLGEVRRIAVLVAAYFAWPEFQPFLQRLAGDDPDSDVREDVRLILESLSRGLERID
jgi:hypothetical protein